MIQFRTYISFSVILFLFCTDFRSATYFLLWVGDWHFLIIFVFISLQSGEQETLLISVYARYCVPRRASIGLLDYFCGVTLLDTICYFKYILDYDSLENISGHIFAPCHVLSMHDLRRGRERTTKIEKKAHLHTTVLLEQLCNIPVTARGFFLYELDRVFFWFLLLFLIIFEYSKFQPISTRRRDFLRLPRTQPQLQSRILVWPSLCETSSVDGSLSFLVFS